MIQLEFITCFEKSFLRKEKHEKRRFDASLEASPMETIRRPSSNIRLCFVTRYCIPLWL